jgi:hypothetical protein
MLIDGSPGLAMKPTVEHSYAARLELACAVWSFCLSDLCQVGFRFTVLRAGIGGAR